MTTRRAFLQSSAAAGASALLNFRVSALDAPAPARPPMRFVFMHRGNGLFPHVVVPRGRIPELFELIAVLRSEHRLRIAAFGHAGDGNIHVNFMVDQNDPEEFLRAKRAERLMFERVVALEGSITGEHGIGFAKRQYLGLELSAETIALMKRVKDAFDPHGILNPGKIFPD